MIEEDTLAVLVELFATLDEFITAGDAFDRVSVYRADWPKRAQRYRKSTLALDKKWKELREKLRRDIIPR